MLREAPLYLWEELDSSDMQVSRDAFADLAAHYQPLVEGISRKLSNRLPPHLDYEELLSMAQLGLLKAFQRYDPSQGQFSKYASAVIWGSIIDGLRASDFAPRGLRKNQRLVEAAIADLKNEGKTSPNIEQIADKMGVTSDEVLTIQKKLARAEITPTDPSLMPTSSRASQEVDHWTSEMCREFVVWLSKYDRVTQEVVLLRYWKGLSFKQISDELEVPFEQVKGSHHQVLSEVLPFMVDLAKD